MECDSGPSFPALPLIQDDGLLRGANLTNDPTDDADLHGCERNGPDRIGSARRKINGAKEEMHRVFDSSLIPFGKLRVPSDFAQHDKSRALKGWFHRGKIGEQKKHLHSFFIRAIK